MLVNSTVVNGGVVNGSSRVTIRPSAELTDPKLTYTFTITGSPNVTIPVESISIRRTLTDVYLSVVVPDITYIDAINARIAGEMYIERTQTTSSGTVLTVEIARTIINNISMYQGARNSSLSIDGHSDPSTPSHAGRTILQASYRSVQNGLRRYRARLDNYLRPGDTAFVNGETFTVGEITTTINSSGETMEFAEN